MDSPFHLLRFRAGLDGVKVDPVAEAMITAHKKHRLDVGTLTDLSDGFRQSLALGSARSAVVEVAVHVCNIAVHRDPYL